MPKSLWLLGLILLAGCRSPQGPVNSLADRNTRNNAYSLLHQLLAEEKDVSLLRFIKHEDDDVKILVNKIAKISGTQAKLLEDFAKQDRTLSLEDLRLPSAEVATRDAISSTKQKELLHRSGDDFRLTLLLTQAEAINYGAHLALVASNNEPDRERARILLSVNAELTGLYREICDLLQVKGPVRK